jgi:hypothetical protein
VGQLLRRGTDADSNLTERDLAFMRVLAQLAVHELERGELEERLVRSQIEASSVLALVAALDARDDYTAEHSEALVDLADAVATRLGLDEATVREVKWMALLHDIGKVGVPDAVLNKPGPLDVEEWALMRRHPRSVHASWPGSRGFVTCRGRSAPITNAGTDRGILTAWPARRSRSPAGSRWPAMPTTPWSPIGPTGGR